LLLLEMGNAKPETLVLLPGLDGTEVFFRPLLASLPEWVRPQKSDPTWSPFHQQAPLSMGTSSRLCEQRYQRSQASTCWDHRLLGR
jgi:hypothetical protein